MDNAKADCRPFLDSGLAAPMMALSAHLTMDAMADPSILLASLPYPDIDPVLARPFGFPIRWYSLAYLGGLILGWLWMRRMAPRIGTPITRQAIDDFLFWATLGVILGGRLGYVIFYKPGTYMADPMEILRLWDGGMSFHGGLIGTTLAILWFCRSRWIPLMRFADLVSLAVPIGLFFGRIANFINGELWGRPGDVPWAMVFPRDPLGVPRHPSQLYEAALEGIVLFLILNLVATHHDLARRRPGVVVGLFCAGYGVARFMVEFFREPDAYLGLIGGVISMGQILSLPLILFGAWLIWRALRVPPQAGRPTGGR